MNQDHPALRRASLLTTPCSLACTQTTDIQRHMLRSVPSPQPEGVTSAWGTCFWFLVKESLLQSKAFQRSEASQGKRPVF